MSMNSNSHPINWLEKRPMLTWTLILVYASIIFIFSSMPCPPQPVEAEDEFIRMLITTIEHIFEYSILGFLLLAGFRSGNGRMREKAILIAILTATIYGITDEIHQFFVPNRDSSILDVLANGIGASLGAFIGNFKHLD